MNKEQNVNQLISSKDYKEFVADGNRIIILTTSWCKTAIMMSIVFDRISCLPKFKTKLKFAKVDVEHFPEIIHHEKVGAVPEFLIYKDGKLNRRDFCNNYDNLEQFIDNFLRVIGDDNEFDDDDY